MMLSWEAIVNEWLPTVVEFKFVFLGCFNPPPTRLALLSAPDALFEDKAEKFVFDAVACFVDIERDASMLAAVPVPGVYWPMCSYAWEIGAVELLLLLFRFNDMPLADFCTYRVLEFWPTGFFPYALLAAGAPEYERELLCACWRVDILLVFSDFAGIPAGLTGCWDNWLLLTST